MKFFNAKWQNLIAINYQVDADFLKNKIPYGTELDQYKGKTYLSLIVFEFNNTKIFNCPIPCHQYFPEMNLRFYVKRMVGNQVRRGVVFIKEVVPKPVVTFFANYLFKERYETLPLKVDKLGNQTSFTIDRQDKNFSLKFEVDTQSNPSKLVGLSEFILEHYWGYSSVSTKETLEYRVEHDPWVVLPHKLQEMKLDFGQIYGEKFSFLNHLKPQSINYTPGSEVSVYFGGKLYN